MVTLAIFPKNSLGNALGRQNAAPELPMPDEYPQAKAHQAIGAYFCAFSDLEHELGEMCRVLLQLERHPMSDAIVAALGDASRKANFVWTAILVAKNADGSDPSPDWKRAADRTMRDTFERNNQRVAFAHSKLQPHDDGSVTLVRQKNEGGSLRGGPKPWTYAEIEAEIARMNQVTEKLRTMKKDLQTLRFQIPEETLSQLLQWRRISRAAWDRLNRRQGNDK
jgi:hypothetical protein